MIPDEDETFDVWRGHGNYSIYGRLLPGEIYGVVLEKEINRIEIRHNENNNCTIKAMLNFVNT